MESRPQFEKRGNVSPDPDPSWAGDEDARDHLKKCAFPGSIPSDNPQNLAFIYLEIDIVQGLELSKANFPLQELDCILLEGTDDFFRGAVLYADVVENDDRFHGWAGLGKVG